MNENTKSRIIQKAIELFNEHGYENVSMRDLAENLNMSPGNLTYHFKKKTDILHEIILLLMKEHEEMQYKSEITLPEFNCILLSVSKHQRQYAFYFRNIIELQKKYPWIAKLQEDYKAEFFSIIRGILRYFEANGWMQAECRENMYKNLSYAILSITTFWTQFNTEQELSSIIWSILFPNLTEKGIIEYQAI